MAWREPDNTDEGTDDDAYYPSDDAGGDTRAFEKVPDKGGSGTSDETALAADYATEDDRAFTRRCCRLSRCQADATPSWDCRS